MAKLIKIQSNISDSKKEKILRAVGASISENLLYSVQFGKKSLFAMCENQLFWHSEFISDKTNFECYESQGKIDRNKNLSTTIFFEDKIEMSGRREKSFTALCIKNNLITRRFDLDFVLTGEEKTALKYFFESYFKDEEISENFKMPKEKVGRVIGLQKEVFGKRVNRFFENTEKSAKSPASLVDDDSKKTNIFVSRETDSFPKILNVLDFIAGLAFLFAVVSLIKYKFWENQEFVGSFSGLNIFENHNVIRVYSIFACGIFAILKLILIAWAKNAIKLPGILIFLIQIVTLFLLSPSMYQASLLKRFIIFFVLNFLLYFCFQMLVGNVFKNTVKKFIALIFCGIVLFLSITVVQTISPHIENFDFITEFKKYFFG